MSDLGDILVLLGESFFTNREKKKKRIYLKKMSPLTDHTWKVHLHIKQGFFFFFMA